MLPSDGRRSPMSRVRRIVVEVAVPPVLAAVLVVLIHPMPYRIEQILLGFPALVFAAYGFAFLPCLAYTAAMELWFLKGMHERCGSICTAGVSSLLGLAAGYLIQLLIPGGGMTLLPIGALDGLVVGA